MVACLNLATLVLARGASRRREIAIRLALGSARARVIRQLVAEGLLLSMGGALCGILAGWWTTSVLTAWLASVLPLGIQVVVLPSWRLIPAAAAFAVLSTVCFALGPSWALTRPDVSVDLKGEVDAARRRSRAGSLLVIGQLAASVALVAAGGLFVRSAFKAANPDVGFSFDRQLIVSIDPSLAGFDEARTRTIYRTALDRLRSVPGVDRVSLASTVPFGEFEEVRMVRLAPSDEGIGADFVIVGSEYFETLGLALLRGRGFTPIEADPLGSGPAGPMPAVIDRVLARRLFGDDDPIGRRVLVQRRPEAPAAAHVVVGVSSDMKHDIFDVAPRPHLFVPHGAHFRAFMTLHIRTAPGASDSQVLSTIRRELLSVDPRLPIISAKTLTEHRDRSVSEWSVRAAAAIFSAFGILALLLAAIGVYGLKAYEVSRRTREFGIRMAIGASAASVLRLVLIEGVRTTAISLSLGLLLAAGLGKLVSGLLYSVSPFDPVALVTAALVLTAAAMTACVVPALRATRVAPAVTLRAE
jgi:predicted permease